MIKMGESTLNKNIRIFCFTNMSLLKKVLLVYLLIGVTWPQSITQASNKYLPDSIFSQLAQHPEAISDYATEELTSNIDKNEIILLCNIISSLNASRISRDIIKQHYFPLCRNIIKSFYDQSETFQVATHHRTFKSLHMVESDDNSTGRQIIIRFVNYQHLLMSIKGLPWDNIITPLSYGDMRMIENFIWGDSRYMDKLDPIPQKIIDDVETLFNEKISSLENDLYRLLRTRSQDTDFLIDNAQVLIKASTYLSQYQVGLATGTILGAYISHGKKLEMLEVIDQAFRQRLGNELWHKLKPIIDYKITGSMEVGKLKDFQQYRDSLLAQHVEFAKYYPHKCPSEMKKGIVYDQYDNKYYEALNYLFVTFVNDQLYPDISLHPKIFNSIGCNSNEEFLRLYTMETLKRYYNNGDSKMWGNIEKIRKYIENASEYPTDIILHIVECYASINAPSAMKLIRHSSLESWLNKQIEKGQPNELLLDAVSVIVYVYASLYNELHYSKILEYIKWTEENIELIVNSKDKIIYNIASALSLMEKYKESNIWISKICVDKSEYNQELYRLLLKNYYELDETKNAIKVASKMKSFSYEDILCYYIAKLREEEKSDWNFLLSTFTTSLSNDFNQFLFMNPDDQEWSLLVTKHRLNKLLFDMDISIWIKDELKENYDSLFKQCFAAMYYNYALASKGAILRSNKKMRELVLNNMPTEQAQYYQQALDFEDDANIDDCLNYRIEKYTSEQLKAILLDYVRKNATNILPQFDYNMVRNQLQPEDIAIEIIQNSKFDSHYNAILIRKDWKFPKIISLLQSEKIDKGQLLWQQLMPFLEGVKRIYISLDGEYNFENIELAKDSTGLCMTDNYKIYRVSTTLYIPKDIYISDIKHSVLYGNLKYADWEDSIKENRDRGAISDSWLPLDDTKDELEKIAEILSNKKILSKLYEKEKGDKASFKTLNRQNIELLHLATHGFFNSEKEANEDISAMKRSGIVLSNSAYDLTYKKQSGTLFANEISNMDLNFVKLLVLSACETANGEIGDDGVFGLQRGFKQAGVGCIIMSLKKVNSKMTTELMTEFYSSFAKGESVRDAFRYAQKQIATKYKIDDWKSFVVLD